MESLIGIRDEDKAELHLYVALIDKHNDLQVEQVDRFEKAKQVFELLAAAWKRLSALDLESMDPAVTRSAEVMTHFMEECRDAQKHIALHANIVQATKEALTLLLAEKYTINIQNEWHLDLEKGILSYDSYVQPPQD